MYKLLHPEELEGQIFNTGGGKISKDPNAMEINYIKKDKGKGKEKPVIIAQLSLL